jgi:hypothetical protein
MNDDRERAGDWDREEYVGAGQAGHAGPADREPSKTDRLRGDEPHLDDLDPDRLSGDDASREPVSGAADHWNKAQWVGDQGHGAPAAMDPDDMPEGESRLSGDRHTPGEEHWDRGQASGLPEATGDRPLDRS